MSDALTPSAISTAELIRRWELASAESRAALSGRLVLAVLGSASAGTGTWPSRALRWPMNGRVRPT